MTSESTRETVRVIALTTALVLSVFAMGASITGTVAASHGGGTVVVDDDGGVGVTNTTIQGAIDHAQAGDVIEVRGGTYVEDVIVDKPVTLVANGSVTIEGAGNSHGAVEIAAGVSDVTIDGFEIRQGTSDHALSVETGGSGSAPNANVTVRNSGLVAADGGFALFAANVVNSRFESNTFTVASGGSAVEIVYVGGARTYGSSRSSSNVEFVDNTFSGSAARSGQPGGAMEFEANESEIRGNDFSGVTTDDGVLVENYGSNVSLSDNTGYAVAGATNLYATVNAAITYAVPGETLHVEPGTYVEPELDVTTPLTLAGAGSDLVTIDRTQTETTGRGIDVQADDVTLSGFTLVGPDGSSSGSTYGLKLGPESVPGDPAENLTVRDVTVEGSTRTAFDLHGVDGAELVDVRASGVAYGNGISFTDTRNVTVDGAVLTGNAWGGIAFYTSDHMAPPLGGTAHVTVRNATIADHAGVGVYAQNGSDEGSPFAELTVESSDFSNNTVQVAELVGHDYRNGSGWLDVAAIAADNEFDRSVVIRESGAVTAPVIFSSVQDGLDVAEAGDEVAVGPGTYDEQLTISTGNVTIVGAGNGASPTSNTLLRGDGTGTGVTVNADYVTVRDLNATDWHDAVRLGTIANVAFDRVSLSGNANIGLDVPTDHSVDGLTVTDSHLDGNEFGLLFESNWRDPGEPETTVTNVLIADTTFDGNSGKGIYAETLENAVLRNLTVVESGQGPNSNGYPNNGIDINLKNGDYSNVTVANSTFEDAGLLTESNAGEDLSGALVIKARDDGSYSGPAAANLTGVTVRDNTFVGTDPDATVALRFGEPDAGNFGPTGITVTGNEFRGYDRPVWDATANSGLDLAAVVGNNTFSESPVVFKLADGGVIFESEAAADASLEAGDVVLQAEDGPNGIYDTIQDAIDAAGDGDDVVVTNGTYTGFTVNKDVTVAAANGATPVVDAQEGQAVIEADGAGLVGLRFEGDYSNWISDPYKPEQFGPAKDPGSVYWGVIYVNASDVLVDDVEVSLDQYNPGVNGIVLSGDEITVTDSTFLVPNGFHGGPILDVTAGSDVTVEGNTFEEGIGGFVGAGQSVTIRSNVFNGTDRSFGLTGPGFGPIPSSATLDVGENGMAYVFPDEISDGTGEWWSDGWFYASASVQSVVEKARVEGTVRVDPGTFHTGKLDVAKAVTIEGAGVGATTLNTTASSTYGVHVTASGVTLRDLGVVGPTDSSSGFGLKVSGTGAPAPINVTLEDVAVTNSARTEIDLNNVRGATLRNVVADGNGTAGVGVAMSATRDVLLENVTTTGNAWGGVGLFDYDPAAGHLQNTSNVTVVNSDLRESNPLYSDQQYGGTLGELYADGYGFAVENHDFRDEIDDRSEDFVFFQEDRVGAVAYARSLAQNDSSAVRTVVRDGSGEIDLGSTFVVDAGLSIQTALDRVPPGGTVDVGPGTYDENVVIETGGVHVDGEGAVIRGQVAVDASSVTVDGFGFRGSDTIPVEDGFTNSIVVNNVGDVTLRNLDLDGGGSVTRAVHLTTIDSGPITIEDTEISGYFLGVNGYGDDVTLRDSVLTDIEEGGVNLQQGDDLRVLNSSIVVGDEHEGNRYGVRFGYTMTAEGQPRDANLTVLDSNLTVAVGDPGDGDRRASVIVRDSALGELAVHRSAVPAGIVNDADTTLDASNNYWGASNGPGGVAPGDGGDVTKNVTFRPFYTNAGMTEDSTAPPSITDARLIDVTNGDGTVGNGDAVRVRSDVTDVSGVASVTVDARPFGGPETLALTDGDGDGVYEAQFTVTAAEANVDGDWSLSVVAADLDGSRASASTNQLTLSTDSETRTSFTVSDTTPLNTEVVDVAVTVRNLGTRSADRTLTLIVDGADVRSQAVTIPAGRNRTVTFQHRFSTGTHTVTVNDSVSTLTGKTVVAKRATNPNARVKITSPNPGDVFATGDVTVEYGLTDASEGIAAVNYSVAGGPNGQITDLGQSEVTLTGLAEGARTVTLTLVDNLGNELRSDSVTFNVDSAEPVLSLDPARTDAIGANRAVAVELTVADDHPDTATFVVRDGSGDVYTEDLSDELADGSETIEWDGTDDSGDPLSTGDYDLVLNATDEAGNANETTATVSVDNDPASVSAVAPNATRLGSGDTLAVDVTASDADSTVGNVTVTLAGVGMNFRTTAEATADSGPWTATFDARDLPVDGNYTVSATATDAANNPGTGAATDEVAVDTTAPTVSAIIDTKDATTGYVNVTVSEDGPGTPTVTLTNDSGTVPVSGLSEIGSSNVYSGTFDVGSGGNYTLEASATDDAGNSGSSTANSTISTLLSATRHTINGADGTVIVLNMTTGTGGTAAFTSSRTPLAELGSNIGSTFLNGELSDDLSDNLENATIRIPTAGNAPPGVDKDNVEIRRYNPSAGQWEPVGTTRVVTVGGTEYFAVTVTTFSTYGPVSPDTVAPSIDETSVNPVGDPLPYATSTVDVTVEYSDNKQVDAAAVTVEYDGSDVTGDADTSISASQATFRADDALVGSGKHWVNVTVVDTAGNEQYENVSFTVDRDVAAPSVSLDDGSFAYGTDPVPIEFTLGDPLSGVDKSSVALEVDGTDVTSSATVTTSRVRYSATGLGSGTHTANLNVSDGAGNWANVSETFTIAADTVPPTVSGRTFSPMLSNGALPAGTTQATITIDYADATSGIDTGAVEVRFDDGTGATDVTDDAVITSGKLTYTAVGLENGSSYTLEADVVDNEGNDVTKTVTFDVASPPSDGGGTGGTTGPSRRERPSVERVSTSLLNGRASVDLTGSVPRIEFDFGDAPASGSVSVQSLAGKPDSVPDIPGVTGFAYIDVTVPSSLSNAAATLRFTVDADAVGDAAPSSLVVYHYKNGAWTTLETAVVSTSGGTIVLEATTPGFSLFAVAAVRQGATTTASPGTTAEQPTSPSTPTGDMTAAPTTAPAGGDETTRPSPTPTATTVEPASFDWPRVVFAGAVVLVVLALFVFSRRR